MKYSRIFFRLIVPVVAVVGIGVIGWQYFNRDSVFQNAESSSRPQVKVVEEVRIQVIPLKTKTDKEFVFRLRLDSTQNQDVLTMSIPKVVILTTSSGEVRSPVKWQVIKKTEYSLEGTLHFQGFSQSVDQFELDLFLVQEIRFNWQLKEGSFRKAQYFEAVEPPADDETQPIPTSVDFSQNAASVE